jgi:hypothetical protein
MDEWNVNKEDWRNDIDKKKKQKYSEIILTLRHCSTNVTGAKMSAYKFWRLICHP